MASVDGALEFETAPSSVDAPTPPSDWTHVAEAALGAWGVFLLLTRQPVDISSARTLALGWRADGLGVYSGPSAEPSTAVVWRIDFADEATAAAAAQIESALGTLSVQQLGVRVVLAKTTGAEPLDWAFAP